MRTSPRRTHPCRERLSVGHHREGSSRDSVALHEDHQIREKGYLRRESLRVSIGTRAPGEALAKRGSAPSASSRGRRAVKKAGLGLLGAPFLNVPAAIIRPRHASIVAKLFERLTCLLRICSYPSRQIGSCDAESAWRSIRAFPREPALKNLAK